MGCSATVVPERVFCDRCAGLLETDTRRALERLYRPGQRHSIAFTRVYDRAIGEILDARQAGRRAPLPREFEW